MHAIDWTVLLATLGFIVGYGVWKTRGTRTASRYLRGDNEDRWWAVTLSVMATQASAITFLSTPGQGFLEGMGFVQFYFGLPLAMVVIAWVFIPLYYKWNVYTAYEFIGKRFDDRTRLLTAILFLIQRGLSTGLTIYAPSIVLSTVLGWPLSWTCVFIGGLVILYTTTGGAKAVGVTHKQQMAVMFGGLFIAFFFLLKQIGEHATFGESLQLAGALGKMNIIDTTWDPATKYTVWSGLIGGFFLQLSYFGTDQSQVQRYLTGQTIRQARVGLLTNGLLKIPMQFFILLIGVLVFVFYLFNASPVHWNAANVKAVNAFTAETPRPSPGQAPTQSSAEESEMTEEAQRVAGATPDARVMNEQHGLLNGEIAGLAGNWVEAHRAGRTDDVERTSIVLSMALEQDDLVREGYREAVSGNIKGAEPNDNDYIFLTWVMDNLPVGLVGLLLAMIFCAGMGSTSSQLSALATTAVVDVFRKQCEGRDTVISTKWATVLFGILALLFAAIFPLFDNLIEAVNVIGSLFYGTILGIFLVAFFMKQIQGTAVFIAGLTAQLLVLVHFGLDRYNVFAVMDGQTVVHDPIEIAFLWYNLIAPAIVVALSLVIHSLQPRAKD
ncbi:MAG: sodium:solute symporter [Flavobacteriales bacterium]|nr:sodium:solute symporter [Flavobacteriales bacterium]